MTKCKWKLGLIFLLGAFFAMYSYSAYAADNQKDILGGRTLTTEDKAIIDKRIAELEKEVQPLEATADAAYDDYLDKKDAAEGLFNHEDFWFNSWVFQWGRSISPLHDNSWETYIAHFREAAQTSMMKGDSEQAQKWNAAITAALTYLEAFAAWNGPATELADLKSIRDHGENVLVYYDEKNKTTVYYVRDESGNYESVAGVTKGCMPLMAKVAEEKNCVFCPLFAQIFSAAQTMATRSFALLAQSLANVMLVGFAIWIAFSVLGKVSSFTKMDAPKYITELLTQVFKVLLAYLLLRDANAIYTYVLGPLLKAGMEFGTTLLFSSNDYLNNCASAEAVKNMPLNGLLPTYLYSQLDCFIRAVQTELSMAQAIGSSLMCVSRHEGKVDDILSVPIPDFSMLLEGLIIWVFAWLLSLAFAFFLVDATVRLGIVGALMPFLIACWPFKVTSKYTSQGFTMFMNTFFTYAFMGLIISINIQLITTSLTGGKGGLDAIKAALNGNNVKVLQDILDIGFSGFLILIACCIFGFKLCMQAAELAGSMAGGGGGSPIAPKIGTLGYQAASNLALGTAKKVGQGAKLAGSFVGTATGITEKVRKGRDKVVGKMQNFFSFGRSGGGSSAPTSRVRGGSGSPAPQGAPSASDNNTPISADQRQQADNVSNAEPRSALGQRADNAGRQNANAQQRQQSNNMQGQQPHGASGQQHSGNAQDQQHGSNSQQQARQTQDQNEADRQRRIDEHNRTMAATADVAASAAGKEIQTRRDEAAQKSRAAAERARVFESNAKAELEAAAELRKKAQAAATETERNDLSRQAQQAEDRAQHNTQAAQSERRTEKEQDVRSKAAQTEFDQLVEERKETISPEEVDQRCTEMYGEGYREEQNRTFK